MELKQPINDLYKHCHYAKHINYNSLNEQIEKENFYLNNNFIYEEMINSFLDNNEQVHNKKTKYNEHLNEDDLFTLTYDFFKNLDSDIFKTFTILFNNKENNISFIKDKINSRYIGYTKKYPNNFIKIEMIKNNNITDLYTLVHEYGHAINHLNNDFNYTLYRKPFSEIESTFLEILLSNYLEKNGFNQKDILYYNNFKFDSIYKDALFMKAKYLFLDFQNLNHLNCHNKNYYKEIKHMVNISKKDIKYLYSINSYELLPYVVSPLYAFELYDMYLKSKEKAMSVYKKIISFYSPSSIDIIKNLESFYLYPNETDTCIRYLKRK